MLTHGGYGNLYGDYWKQTEKGWLARVPGQATLIESLSVDWFVAAELHAEKNAHLPLMEALGDVWAVATGPGGNLLIYKKDRVKVLNSKSSLSCARWMTKWNLEQNGVRFWVAGVHFTAGSTKAADRVTQAQDLVAFTSTLHRAIICGDLNSATFSPGYPRAILNDAGWVDLRLASKTPVANATVSSHAKAEDDAGLWIEGMFPRDLVTVNAASAVLTKGLSDHTLWFRADFDVKD